MDTKQHILIAGCGDLGSALADLLKHQHQVYGLRRQPQALPQGITAIGGDVTDIQSLQPLQQLSPSILVYCASAGGQNDESYHAVYVQGLKNVLQSITQQQLKHVFFVSSTRVYNGNTEDLIDESVPAIANDFGGYRLLEAEQVLSTLSCGHTVLRLSGIYGPGRTRMIKLAQTPALWPPTNSWSNRIHRDDAANFIAFLIEKLAHNQTPEPLYIVTDGVPTPQYEVLMWIAKQLNIDIPTQQPIAEGGKRLKNRALIATQFSLQYPQFKVGYHALLQTQKEKS
jgi:nucleoside-diphosphate-sugar epimerase